MFLAVAAREMGITSVSMGEKLAGSFSVLHPPSRNNSSKLVHWKIPSSIRPLDTDQGLLAFKLCEEVVRRGVLLW